MPMGRLFAPAREDSKIGVTALQPIVSLHSQYLQLLVETHFAILRPATSLFQILSDETSAAAAIPH
jgi:hypothetical protein